MFNGAETAQLEVGRLCLPSVSFYPHSAITGHSTVDSIYGILTVRSVSEILFTVIQSIAICVVNYHSRLYPYDNLMHRSM